MTESRTLPSMFDLLVVIAAGLVIHDMARSWVFTTYRIGTAMWLLTFLYAALRHHFPEETR